jgi:predicted nucleic acid-binding protein
VARHHGLAIATRDTRDFPPERYDFVRVPYTVEARP